MFPAIRLFRNPVRSIALLLGMVVLSACQISNPLGGSGPSLGSNQTVQVAMLLPVGSGQGGDAVISRNLENAARMAVGDLGGGIEITVYDTRGQAAQAAAVAQQAVAEGADVIVGPLRSDAAAAVGVAVANSNVSVLSFSNNTEIAGGNVFVLGHTFENTANRIMSYAVRQGRNQIVIAHGNNLAGQVARDATQRAAQQAGATVAAVVPYEFSQTGVVSVVPTIVQTMGQTGSNGLLLTADSAGALPFLAQLLPENGLDLSAVQVMGLTRWDTPPQTRELPGLQGGWFALPDPSAAASFNARYSQTYGETAHILAALGYDAIRAVGETAARENALGAGDLTRSSGFSGANGVFRLRGDGTNARAMAIAQVNDNQVAIIDPAPRSLGGFGF